MSPAALDAGARDPRLDPEPALPARLVARIAAALLRLRAPRPDPAALRRVLVVRTDDRVGNALLTIPLVRALQQQLPAAQIDLLLASGRACVAAGLPGLRVLPFDKRDPLRHPLRFLRFLRALRSAGYDAAIDAAHWHAFSLTSALLARWAGLRRVVGSNRGATALYSDATALPPAGLRETEAKLLLLRGLGLAPPLASPPLETALGTSPAASARARAVFDGLGLQGRFVAVNPGARKADHRWAASSFGALASALHERHGLRSLVLWGPGELPIAEAVCASSGGHALLAPATGLDALAALFRAAALVVANDTGPMHLAVACGAPVLAIALSLDAERWGHPGPRFRLVRPAPGAPLEGALTAAAALLALTANAAQVSLRDS